MNFYRYQFKKGKVILLSNVNFIYFISIGWFGRTYGHSRRRWTVGSGRSHILGYWLRITQSTGSLHEDNQVCWMDQSDYHLLKTTLWLRLQILHSSFEMRTRKQDWECSRKNSYYMFLQILWKLTVWMRIYSLTVKCFLKHKQCVNK